MHSETLPTNQMTTSGHSEPPNTEETSGLPGTEQVDCHNGGGAGNGDPVDVNTGGDGAGDRGGGDGGGDGSSGDGSADDGRLPPSPSGSEFLYAPLFTPIVRVMPDGATTPVPTLGATEDGGSNGGDGSDGGSGGGDGGARDGGNGNGNEGASGDGSNGGGEGASGDGGAGGGDGGSSGDGSNGGGEGGDGGAGCGDNGAKDVDIQASPDSRPAAFQNRP